MEDAARDVSEEDRLQVLAKPIRDLFDGLAMIVYREGTRLAAARATGLSHTETARALVKAMLCSDVRIVPDPSADMLTLQFLHQSRKEPDHPPLSQALHRTRSLRRGQAASDLKDPPRTVLVPGQSLPARPSRARPGHPPIDPYSNFGGFGGPRSRD